MKWLLTLLLCCVFLAACHSWTGITTAQLAKKMGGPPQAIRTSGAYKIYVYRDPMGGGQLSFYVDKEGVVQKWTGAPAGGSTGSDSGEAPEASVPAAQ